MLPGPKRLYRCPTCQGLFARRTLASGNTLGAEFRSDGQMRARMLPQTPPLVACPHCRSTFCMLDAKHEIEYRDYFPGWGFTGEKTPEQIAARETEEALAEEYKDVPAFEQATLSQCLLFVQRLDNDRLPLRLYTWQRVNDERIQAPRTLTDAEVTSLQALLPLLGGPNDDEALLKAELLRELGQFALAAQVLDRDIDSDLAARAEQIMQAIERQDTQPFIFAPDHDDGDIEFVWAWRARRYKPDEPEDAGDAPLDPPNFQISNRDWWVKVLGMCSHNWALIEPQTPSGVVIYFFHDMGTTLRPNGFKPGQIRGRSGVVDSLSFCSVQDAQQALRGNGFERLVQYPGPWFGFEPMGHFYDARATEEGIYSRKGYWTE